MTNERIHDEFHPHIPVLRKPSEASQIIPPDAEEEIAVETLIEAAESKKKPSLPLKARIKQIPQNCLNLFKDWQLMSMVVDLFGSASQICTLSGTAAGKIAPYITILSSPFYLYHTITDAGAQLRLLYCACKTSRVAEAFFRGGKALGSVGTALSDIAKPFAGGVTIFGLSHVPAVGFTFSFILPIILIAFGAIGGTSEGWALGRAAKTLQEFNKRTANVDKSLEDLVSLLEYLQNGPDKIFSGKSPAAENELNMQNFKDNWFTNDKRRLAIKAKIDNLISTHDLHKILSTQEMISSTEVQEAVHPLLEFLQDPKVNKVDLQEVKELISDLQGLYKNLLDPEISTIRRLDIEISLFDHVLTLFQREEYSKAWNIEENSIKSLVEDMAVRRDELLKIKSEILQKGNEIIDTARSEIHRKISEHSAFLFMATLTMVAGILFLLPGTKYQLFGSSLTLVGAAINISYILFSKSVSQERFLQMERFLRLLRERKEIDSQVRSK